MAVQFPFHFHRIACCIFAWSSLFWCHHHAHREWPLLLLLTTLACFIGSFSFQLRHGMSPLPPWWSNRTSNSYRLRLIPLSILVSPLGVISAVRSGASRSNAIHTVHVVNLLNRYRAINGSFLSPLLTTHQSLSGIAPLSSKTTYHLRAPRSILLVSERVLPCPLTLFHFFICGSPAPHASKCSGLPHLGPFYLAMRN